MNNQAQHESPKANFTSKQASPYLPTRQGFLKERLVLIHANVAYWKWKRIIHKYGPKDGDTSTRLSILDTGCGPGKFVHCLRRWFPDANIFGLDMSIELIDYASQRTERVNWLNGSAEQIPLDDKALDVLSCLQVIEHLNHPDAFLNEANRVLKSEGLLLVATPNPQGLGARMLKQKWQGIRDDHISLNPPQVWGEMFKANGFRLLSEGTTLFNGIPLMRRFPFNLPFVLLQAVFGWFPWVHGESYMAVLKKNG